MPQRFLRPGITNSERWNAVSWSAQSFYIRILTLVDDYGRCDGRASVLWGACFSVWNELNPESCCKLQQVTAMLQELSDAKLIELYENEGKIFVQMVQWQERIREGTRSKWPDPQQVAASCSKLLPPSPSPSPSPSPTPTPTPNAVASLPLGVAIPESLKLPAFVLTWADWKTHRREIRKPLKPTMERKQLKMLEAMGVPRAVSALNHSMAQGYQGVVEPRAAAQGLPGASGNGNGNGNGHGAMTGADKMIALDELDRVQKGIATLRNSYEAHQDWPQEDREKLHKLKKRLRELKDRLGMVV